MKEYTLLPAVRGLEVVNDDEKYFVSLKMFSLSAKTFDSLGVQIASMKRSSWWRLNYKIEAEDEIYTFESSALDGTLIATSANEKFITNGTTEFYELKGKKITELSKRKLPLGSLNLKIHNDNHVQAFMIVSCLFYKTVIEAPGYAI